MTYRLVSTYQEGFISKEIGDFELFMFRRFSPHRDHTKQSVRLVLLLWVQLLVLLLLLLLLPVAARKRSALIRPVEQKKTMFGLHFVLRRKLCIGQSEDPI